MSQDEIAFVLFIIFVIVPAILIIIMVICFYLKDTWWYQQYKKYKEEKKRLKALAKEIRYERKLEKYRSRLHLDDPESDLPEEDSSLVKNFQTQKENQFNDFLKFAHQQMEKFSLYTSNDKTLQHLLDETFLSISRLTARLTPDNYMASSQRT